MRSLLFFLVLTGLAGCRSAQVFVAVPLDTAAFPMQACLDHACTWDSKLARCFCPSNFIGDHNPNPVIPGPLNQPPR